MRLPDSLRKWLLKSVPGLSRSPDALHLFIEDGAVHSGHAGNLSYLYAYTLVVTIENRSAASHEVLVPIMAWLQQHQPELLRTGPEGIGFEQDILDNKLNDFEIHLPLKERVLVTPRDGGGWDVSYPVPEEPVDYGPLKQLWLDLFPDADPAWLAQLSSI